MILDSLIQCWSSLLSDCPCACFTYLEKLSVVYIKLKTKTNYWDLSLMLSVDDWWRPCTVFEVGVASVGMPKSLEARGHFRHTNLNFSEGFEIYWDARRGQRNKERYQSIDICNVNVSVSVGSLLGRRGTFILLIVLGDK